MNIVASYRFAGIRNLRRLLKSPFWVDSRPSLNEHSAHCRRCLLNTERLRHRRILPPLPHNGSPVWKPVMSLADSRRSGGIFASNASASLWAGLGGAFAHAGFKDAPIFSNRANPHHLEVGAISCLWAVMQSPHPKATPGPSTRSGRLVPYPLSTKSTEPATPSRPWRIVSGSASEPDATGGRRWVRGRWRRVDGRWKARDRQGPWRTPCWSRRGRAVRMRTLAACCDAGVVQ